MTKDKQAGQSWNDNFAQYMSGGSLQKEKDVKPKKEEVEEKEEAKEEPPEPSNELIDE